MVQSPWGRVKARWSLPMSETATQAIERRRANLTALQQELEKMTAGVPRHWGTKEDLRWAIAAPVLAITGK